MVLATVKGDIHDLGKNIVAALMENNGFKIIDLGVDVPMETIVEAALTHQADIVGIMRFDDNYNAPNRFSNIRLKKSRLWC